jgi:hypothetical protein
MFGDAKHVIDFGRDEFGMDADHWTALQAIHGVVHNAAIGLKYTWFGAGYLSNMYFKMIANKPTYRRQTAIPMGLTTNLLSPMKLASFGT